MFAVAVLLWVAVYVPNWGAAKDEKKQGSTFGGKFSKISSNKSQNTSNGVSQLAIRNKNIRLIRSIFSVLLIASLVAFAIGVMLTIASISWWLLPASSLIVFALSASTLRSSRHQKQKNPALSIAELDAQRARMAYSIREAALRDSKVELLFDERAWSSTELPESDFARRLGEIEEVQLARVSEISQARDVASDNKLDSDELDRILQRRRAI